MDVNKVLYDNVSMADIFKEIHLNSKSKHKQIEKLILQLQPLIKNINDAVVIVPLIKDYLDVSVKNDEQLIKLVGVAQRLFGSIKKKMESSEETGETFGFTDAELKAIQKEIDDLQKGK